MDEIKCCCKQKDCDAIISILDEEDTDAYTVTIETSMGTVPKCPGTFGGYDSATSIVLDKVKLAELISKLNNVYLQLKEF